MPKLYLAFVAVFLLGSLTLVHSHGLPTAAMVSFDVAVCIFLIGTAATMRRGSAQRLRRHAERYDPSRPLLLTVAALTIGIIVAAIGIELAGAEPLTKRHLALATTTLFLAWLFGNTTFALHYAHLFYGQRSGDRGLQFPGTDTPDFWDFCYFSFVVGMTFQVSDVAVSSQAIRRRVVVHGLAAFLFNVAAVALTVNIIGTAR